MYFSFQKYKFAVPLVCVLQRNSEILGVYGVVYHIIDLYFSVIRSSVVMIVAEIIHHWQNF